MQHRYVFGPGSDEPLLDFSGTGTTSPQWLIADQRGSIIALANASGTVASSAVALYDEYGNPSPSNPGERFQYTGQAWLSGLSLYYYKARFYNPALGRFMQSDPTGYSAGLNLYAYAGLGN